MLNSKKFKNQYPKKWSRLLTRSGRLLSRVSNCRALAERFLVLWIGIVVAWIMGAGGGGGRGDAGVVAHGDSTVLTHGWWVSIVTGPLW